MRTRKLSLYRALAGLALTATIAFVCTLFASAPSANAQYHEPAPEPVVVAPPPPRPEPKPEPVHVPPPVDHKIPEQVEAAKSSLGAFGPSTTNNVIGSAIHRAINQAANQVVGAGVAPAKQEIDEPGVVTDTGGPVSAIFAEYIYLNIHDSREFGPSGDSHGLQIGYDVALADGLVLGAIYGYDRRNLDAGGSLYSSKTDSHVISAFVSKSFADYFSAGLVGGYGNISSDINIRNASIKQTIDIDAWNVSPFLGAAYTSGAFSAFGNLNYVFYDAGETSQKLGIEGGVAYDLTEILTLGGYVGYNYMVDKGAAAPDLPALEWWLAFGAKLSAKITEQADLYIGYEYDLYDSDDFNTHMATAGLAIQF